MDANGIMRYGRLSQDEPGSTAYYDEYSQRICWDFSNIPVSNMTLSQFTGLKDKNDKEIYEGDILKWGLGEDKTLTTIEFFDGAFRFAGDQVVQEDECLGDYGFEQYGEVIGNIYENPELLTPTKATEKEV